MIGNEIKSKEINKIVAGERRGGGEIIESH
jgi:hypothetical protein